MIHMVAVLRSCRAGLDEKGVLLDRGIDKIAATLNGTYSHENLHEVSPFVCALSFRLVADQTAAQIAGRAICGGCESTPGSEQDHLCLGIPRVNGQEMSGRAVKTVGLGFRTAADA